MAPVTGSRSAGRQRPDWSSPSGREREVLGGGGPGVCAGESGSSSAAHMKDEDCAQSCHSQTTHSPQRWEGLAVAAETPDSSLSRRPRIHSL